MVKSFSNPVSLQLAHHIVSDGGYNIRKIDPTHVQNLVENITKHGWDPQSKLAVFVDPKDANRFVLIDGHHREAAAKQAIANGILPQDFAFDVVVYEFEGTQAELEIALLQIQSRTDDVKLPFTLIDRLNMVARLAGQKDSATAKSLYTQEEIAEILSMPLLYVNTLIYASKAFDNHDVLATLNKFKFATAINYIVKGKKMNPTDLNTFLQNILVSEEAKAVEMGKHTEAKETLDKIKTDKAEVEKAIAKKNADIVKAEAALKEAKPENKKAAKDALDQLKSDLKVLTNPEGKTSKSMGKLEILVEQEKAAKEVVKQLDEATKEVKSQTKQLKQGLTSSTPKSNAGPKPSETTNADPNAGSSFKPAKALQAYVNDVLAKQNGKTETNQSVFDFLSAIFRIGSPDLFNEKINEFFFPPIDGTQDNFDGRTSADVDANEDEPTNENLQTVNGLTEQVLKDGEKLVLAGDIFDDED